MNRNLLFAFFLLCFGVAQGQSNLSGKVMDKADNKPLSNASIVILNTDSILQHFGRVNESGRFEIKGIDQGKYLMLVTYPKFEIISKEITIGKEDLKLEDIEVNSQMNILEEIVVTQRIPIRIKGDTIEYDAASFETEKNAKLEDLFRRLPGLTVSANGDITAQGKTVSKVLIDGEEFFGYDPKIAIRNIRADAVDKVQVYERKSEESEFTGIDDGQRFQTVNVILKEEAREGIFGSAEASYGTEDLYTANLFAAKFNRTERIGLTGNINNMGSSGGGREGSLRTNSQITGNPHAESIGASYENQLLNKRLNVNANYNFGNNGNENENTTYNKSIINQEQIQETYSTSQSSNHNQNNGLRTQFRLRIDSSQNVSVNFNANLAKSESTRKTESEIFRDGENARDSRSSNASESNTNSNDLRINYRKRLNRDGRSLNVHFNNQYSSDESKNRVYTEDYDYTRDTVKIDQNRIGDGLKNNFETQVSFNDRFSQRANYSIGYSYRQAYNKDLTDAYDLDDAGNITNRDAVYSKNQIDNNKNQAVDLAFNYNDEKWVFNLTNSTSFRDQSLKDLYRDIDWTRTFWDNNVNINLNYNITKSRGIGLIYQNNFNIPSFSQLQPVQPRVNEYYEVIGNPDLKRSMNNGLRLNFNTFSLMKMRSISLNSDIRLTSNPIVSKTDVADDTKTTVTYENVMGKSNLNVGLNAIHSKPFTNKGIQFNQSASISYGDEYNYINSNITGVQREFILNNSKTTSGNFGIGINEQNSAGFDFDINGRIGLNAENNSARPDLDAVNFTAGSTGYIKYFLPKKFYITTNAVYEYTGPTKIFDESIHQFYTNLELSKTILKSESLVISVKAFDLFNTFNNINRSASNTSFSETQQQILTRYVLFGLKWDFNKNLGKKSNG